jgi:serine protease Do
VVSVEPGGPAGASGIQVGDIVVAMNGRAVESVDDLHRLLSEAKGMDRARIDLLRGTERVAVEVVVGEAAGKPVAASGDG